MSYVFGPVPSRRLGLSLGIDLIPVKTCTYDCLYCQVGPTKLLTAKRRLFVPTQKIIQELKRLPKLRLDYITFSGRGEPTLASNLGQAIKAVKKLRPEPVAVLTNASLLNRKSVRDQLLAADLVMIKLDAASPELLHSINKPAKGISLAGIIKGIKQFKRVYRGKLVLAVMFMPQNKQAARVIAGVVRTIKPDQVQICTPVRPSAVQALSMQQIRKIRTYFRRSKVVSLYDVKRKRARPLSAKGIKFRRGGR